MSTVNEPPVIPPFLARDNIEVERESIVMRMQRKNPGMRLTDINEIAYRVDSDAPIQILKKEGFLPEHTEISVTPAENPNNKGLVEFSLVPEAAAISSIAGKKQFLYAAPVDKAYLMQGQKRQILVPALPLPEFCVARAIVESDGRKVTLGKPVIMGTIPEKFTADETFQRFMNASQLTVPPDIALGDENYAAHYVIKDTPVSERFFPSR